jgi:N6-L-threonylcarbamoyladenine synthase
VLILSIETSCDETAVAVTRNGREVLADEIYSQADMHALYGGVVPELASRNHIAVIGRLSDMALEKAGITRKQIDAVAVTFAPGLIGALLVGVSFAKGLALALEVPLIPVHHIRGHIAANYIAYPELEPPFLSLIVSGGNSLIADVRGYTDIRIIGSSRDDAAGECFDKVARVLGLPYPGGKPLDELSRGGDDTAFKLPRSKIDGYPYDMSFSGLKTAVVNIVHNAEQKGETLDTSSLAASFAYAVSDTLIPRTMEAARELSYNKIAIAGGVAANSRIRADFEKAAAAESKTLYIPPLSLCGDNGAMIGCQAYYEYLVDCRAGMALNAFATMDVDSSISTTLSFESFK